MRQLKFISNLFSFQSSDMKPTESLLLMTILFCTFNWITRVDSETTGKQFSSEDISSQSSSPFLLASPSLTSSSTPSSSLKQQYFKIKPIDLEIVEGATAELECQIGNQIGAVQWSKDGLLLGNLHLYTNIFSNYANYPKTNQVSETVCEKCSTGYRSTIPGMPRYKMIADTVKGIYNLKISSVQIEDEGEYQCQVGPAPNQLPIRASSQLTVIVPPKSLTISGSVSPEISSSDSPPQSGISRKPDLLIIEVKESEKVILICLASQSKPPPRVKWFRKNIELLPEASRTYYNKSIVNNRYLLYTTESSIILYPKSEGQYSCEIEHPGLSKTFRASSIINIFNEPGQPIIEGYREGDSVVLGDLVVLTCTSKGGYPMPKVYWYRNGLEADKSYNVNSKNDVINSYSFTASIDDNQSVYKCSVTSNLTNKPLEAAIRLNVLYLPSKVTIQGPTETRLFQSVELKCTTRPGNPPPLVTWLIDGNVTSPTTVKTQSDTNGNGWIVISTLSYIISTRIPSVMFTCKAEGLPQKTSISTNHQVNIIYPPNPPTLTGYKENMPMESGSLHKIKCVSLGGNPPPVLKWYKHDKEISTISSVSGSGVSNELVIRPEYFDHGVEYKCIVNHSALSKPYSVSFNLNVIYGATITEPIRVKRTFGRADQWPAEGDDSFQIHCIISSNPEPRVKWFRDDNGSPMDWFRVKYKLEARSGHFISILTVSNVTRSDAGLYSCSATNSLNTVPSVQSVRVFVEYGPFIARSPKKIAADVGDSSIRLPCHADGYPNVNFNWSVSDRISSLSSSLSSSSTSSKYNIILTPNLTDNVNSSGSLLQSKFQSDLIINNVIDSDFGPYRCIAYNYLGQDIFDIELVRKSIPEAPTNLTLVNVTHNTITIRWNPAFDGGYEQSYRIRYKAIKNEAPNKPPSDYYYAYGAPGSSSATLVNLDSGTEYILTISSRNKLGESLISREFIRTRTLNIPVVISRNNPIVASAGERKSEEGLLGGHLTFIVTALIIGISSCFLITLVIVIYYKRRLVCDPTNDEQTSEEVKDKQSASDLHHHVHHHHTHQSHTLEGGFVPAELSNEIPFVISSNSVGICKCDPPPTLMVIEEKIQIQDLTQDKCYTFSSNKDYENKLMTSLVEGGQQPDILMNQIKDGLVNHAICCEGEYKVLESCDGSVQTLATLRRIPRVNIIEGEYTLTTVPEEEMEEIL